MYVNGLDLFYAFFGRPACVTAVISDHHLVCRSAVGHIVYVGVCVFTSD